MKTGSIVISAFALAAMLLSACGAAAVKMVGPEGRDATSGTVELGVPAPQTAPELGGSFVANDSNTTSASSDRLVIKNANLSIVVDDPEKSMADISALADQLGGFVVSSSLYQSTLSSGLEVPSASITIRVPAASLQSAIDRIQAGARDVLTSSQSGQDVTAEYTDLQSRLRNLEAAETLLRQIMDKATKTEDILNAFNQLNSITEQIEVLKGQIKYYEESSAMSAISVDLIASQSVQPITIGGWEPVGVAKDAIQSLMNALQAIANALIWLVGYVLPLAALAFVGAWLIIRGLRRWGPKGKSATKRRK